MFGTSSFIVNAEKYNDPIIQSVVKRSIHQAIEIEGKRSAQDDLRLFMEIAQFCNESITKLTINCMALPVEIDSISVFQNLKELTLAFNSLHISWMQLDKWCPNLVRLNIQGVNFGKKIWYENWLSLSESHKCPQLKSLSFHCDDVNNQDIYFYLEAMEMQFPSLESLDLKFDTNVSFSSRYDRFNDSFNEDDDYDYEPLYFDKLKKLKVFAFGECDNIFKCLAISNKKLNELEFSGMVADEKLIESICNYPKITKLKLDCPYVYESDLVQLSTRLPKLKTLILDTKYFDWSPSEMMQFMQGAKQLRNLDIEVDRRNDDYDIDDEFIEQFRMLIENGRKLKLHIKFYQSGREIKFSQNGTVDKSEWDD